MSSRLPGAHQAPCTAAGTTQRWTRESFSRPTALSGTSTLTVRSGSQSPMSQSWETTRVPGASASRRGLQLQVDGRQQVHRHHGGAAEIGGEQVLLAELDPLLHAGGARRCAALGHQLRHDLDAEAAGAEAPRRGDDDAAVAGAEIDHVIGRTDGGELEHRQRHLVGRGDEGHLVLALAAPVASAATAAAAAQRLAGPGDLMPPGLASRAQVPACSACQTRSEVAGIWISSAARRAPAWASASATAFIVAGVAPMVPSSPTPLTPSGLVRQGIEVSKRVRKSVRRRPAASRSP